MGRLVTGIPQIDAVRFVPLRMALSTWKRAVHIDRYFVLRKDGAVMTDSMINRQVRRAPDDKFANEGDWHRWVLALERLGIITEQQRKLFDNKYQRMKRAIDFERNLRGFQLLSKTLGVWPTKGQVQWLAKEQKRVGPPKWDPTITLEELKAVGA
jgi:hypothetical protein